MSHQCGFIFFQFECTSQYRIKIDSKIHCMHSASRCNMAGEALIVSNLPHDLFFPPPHYFKQLHIISLCIKLINHGQLTNILEEISPSMSTLKVEAVVSFKAFASQLPDFTVSSARTQ